MSESDCIEPIWIRILDFFLNPGAFVHISIQLHCSALQKQIILFFFLFFVFNVIWLMPSTTLLWRQDNKPGSGESFFFFFGLNFQSQTTYGIIVKTKNYIVSCKNICWEIRLLTHRLCAQNLNYISCLSSVLQNILYLGLIYHCEFLI